MSADIHSMEVCTTWGNFVVQTSGDKVVGCTLPRVDESPDIPFSVERKNNDPITLFISDLFNGRNPSIPPFEKLEGTDFQRTVWTAISAIPKGETKTYGELAQAIENPKAFRAVANACGANPLPLFIPCHRVVGANNTLGGFSCGIAWKELLLAAEQ